MDVYAKAKTELADIDSRIAELQKRKSALRQFIDLGDSLFGPPHVGPADGTAVVMRQYTMAEASAMMSELGRPRVTAKARIIEASIEILTKTGPLPTRALLMALESEGVDVGGSDKLGSLSVLLSKSARFESDRKLGWSLRDAQKEATPQGAQTPAGSDVELDLS